MRGGRRELEEKEEEEEVQGIMGTWHGGYTGFFEQWSCSETNARVPTQTPYKSLHARRKFTGSKRCKIRNLVSDVGRHNNPHTRSCKDEVRRRRQPGSRVTSLKGEAVS